MQHPEWRSLGMIYNNETATRVIEAAKAQAHLGVARFDETWNRNFDEFKEHVKQKLPLAKTRRAKWLRAQLSILRGKAKMSDERKRVFFALVKEFPGVFPSDIVRMARFDAVDSDESEPVRLDPCSEYDIDIYHNH